LIGCDALAGLVAGLGDQAVALADFYPLVGAEALEEFLGRSSLGAVKQFLEIALANSSIAPASGSIYDEGDYCFGFNT
jgi:hypothetical protein